MSTRSACSSTSSMIGGVPLRGGALVVPAWVPHDGKIVSTAYERSDSALGRTPSFAASATISSA